MIQVRAVIILLSAAALLLAFRAVLADNKAGFLDRKISIGASDYRYKVFIPADRNPRTKGPIILFLHGAGERGDDNEAQTRVGVGPALLKQPADFPAVVVFPQCPRNRWWNEPEMEAMALNILDAAVTEFNGDSSRIVDGWVRHVGHCAQHGTQVRRYGRDLRRRETSSRRSLASRN
jgi:predicted peptidase